MATSIEENLERYLETETLLNDFFRVFDYCMTTCVPAFLKESGGKPVALCCKNRYHVIMDLDHPAFDRLRAEREKRFGKPEDQELNPDPVSPCEYHGPLGCRLKTHKSPICVAFMCRKSIDYLRETYGVYTYDYLGVYYALEWILTGDFSIESYREFRESIVQMTRRLECS